MTDTVAEHPARLCEARDAQIFRLQDGAFRLAASHGPLAPARQVPVTRSSAAGRAVIGRQTVHLTPEGGRVDVRATVVDGTAEVSVADTGVGIAPEDQKAAFEEFRRVGTTDKKVEGTRLGLTLSQRFVELHGGRISVESQVGVGSTFTFHDPDSDLRMIDVPSHRVTVPA